jgi:hypothetical protein
MLKKGVLSTAEKFYIESHRSLEPVQIAKSINRNVETIEKYLKKLSSYEKKTEEQIKPADDQENEKKQIKGRVSQMLARHKGSIVMTPNASEMGDLSTKNSRKTSTENAIFRPMGEK